MNKPVHPELSILELGKRVVHELWHDYVKPKYGEKAKLCYMDTGSFIVYIKTDDIYKNISEDVKARLDTSNYELDRHCQKEKPKGLLAYWKMNYAEKAMK